MNIYGRLLNIALDSNYKEALKSAAEQISVLHHALEESLAALTDPYLGEDHGERHSPVVKKIEQLLARMEDGPVVQEALELPGGVTIAYSMVTEKRRKALSFRTGI
ncbi:MAG: hypothetical protein WC291_00530 [Thermodesulfovibrionales bacterium]|jgi:hypothetical protein